MQVPTRREMGVCDAGYISRHNHLIGLERGREPKPFPSTAKCLQIEFNRTRYELLCSQVLAVIEPALAPTEMERVFQALVENRFAIFLPPHISAWKSAE